MNSTLDHADRRTHVKIIAVAVLAAALVLLIGKTAHPGASGITRPAETPARHAPVERPTAPAVTLVASR